MATWHEMTPQDLFDLSCIEKLREEALELEMRATSQERWAQQNRYKAGEKRNQMARIKAAIKARQQVGG